MARLAARMALSREMRGRPATRAGTSAVFTSTTAFFAFTPTTTSPSNTGAPPTLRSKWTATAWPDAG